MSDEKNAFVRAGYIIHSSKQPFSERRWSHQKTVDTAASSHKTLTKTSTQFFKTKASNMYTNTARLGTAQSGQNDNVEFMGSVKLPIKEKLSIGSYQKRPLITSDRSSKGIPPYNLLSEYSSGQSEGLTRLGGRQFSLVDINNHGDQHLIDSFRMRSGSRGNLMSMSSTRKEFSDPMASTMTSAQQSIFGGAADFNDYFVKKIELKKTPPNTEDLFRQTAQLDRIFSERFRATEQKQETNLLDIKLLEKKSLIKQLPLASKPIDSLSQRERIIVSRLHEITKEDITPLTINPRSHQNVQTPLKFKKETEASVTPQPGLGADSGEGVTRSTPNLILFVALGQLYRTNVHKLNYCYYPRPILKQKLRDMEVLTMLQSLIEDVRSKMFLPKNYKYIYSKDGKRVRDFIALAEGNYVFFISSMSKFDGIHFADTANESERVWHHRLVKEITKLEYPIIAVSKNPDQHKVHARTVGQTINENYGKVKQDIIDFVSLGAGGLDSRSLHELWRKAKRDDLKLSDLGNIIPAKAPSAHFLVEEAIKGSENQPNKPSNTIVEGLRSSNYHFFKSSVINKFCSEFQNQQLPKIHGRVEEEDVEGENDLIEKIKEMYINDDQLIVQSKDFKTIDLLLHFYEQESKQSAQMSDETLLKNQLVMELSALLGKDARDIVAGRKLLKSTIENNLEKILKRSSYKLSDVEVNKNYLITEAERSEDKEAKHKKEKNEVVEDLEGLEVLKAKGHIKAQLARRDSQMTTTMDKSGDFRSTPSEVQLDLEKVTKKKSVIKRNREAVMDMKSVIKLINTSNPPLISQNIPHLSNQTNFSRSELHSLYTMYKALCYATSQRYGVMEYDAADGIDEETFRKGVYQVFIQSDLIANKIFGKIDYNFSKYMNWPEFINGMQMIKAKTLADKIGLFIRLADENEDRMLDAKEIDVFCRACLDRFIKEDDDQFLEIMVEYFRKLIFESLGYSEEDDIPLDEVRNYILKGGENAQLLIMFCGADF